MVVNPAAADVPCRMLISSWQAELVAGERDEGVKRVRVESGANVQLLDKALPEAFRARDECLVVVTADDPAQLRAAISGTLRRAFNLPRGAVDERQRTVEVMIPEVACRHLVGARGDRIKLLREEAGCDVQLAPGPVAGVAAQRRVRCGGPLRGVEEAVARVHEVLVEFASIGILHPRHFDLQQVSAAPAPETAREAARNSRVAVRLLVSKDECGWLIGKRGNKIHKLRELALVSTRDAAAEIQDEGSESVVEIFGAPLAKELCVLQLIVDDLAMMREALPTSRLVVPVDHAAALSARLEAARVGGGAAGLHISARGQSWCVVELEGNERERLAAASAIHDIIEQEASEREANALGAAGRAGLRGGNRGLGCAASGAGGPADGLRPTVAPAAAGLQAAAVRAEAPPAAAAPPASAASRGGAQASEPAAQGAGEPGATGAATAPPPAAAPPGGAPLAVAAPASAASLPQEERQVERRACVAAAAPRPREPAAACGAAPCDPPVRRGEPPPRGSHAPLARGALAEGPPAAPAGPVPAGGARPCAPGCTALRLALPGGAARRLASDCSGIARRAGVALSVDYREGACGAEAVLLLEGTPPANALACYLVQKLLWLDATLGVR